MKQKNNLVKSKQQQNGVQSKPNMKPPQKKSKPAVVVAANPVKKNSMKAKNGAPLKVVPPKHVEEEEEDESDEDDDLGEEEDDSGADVDDGLNSLLNLEVEESDDEDESGEEEGEGDESDGSDDDDEDEALQLEGQNSDDESDEAPAEIPIAKAKKGRANDGLQIGLIQSDTPDEQIIYINNLPKKFKPLDLVEQFMKYGKVCAIKVLKSNLPASAALMAFETAKAAKAALAANGVAKFEDKTLTVSLKSPNVKKQQSETKQQIEELKPQTIYVSHIKSDTTEQQLREHFEGCGDIEYVNLLKKKSIAFAFIAFKTIEAAQAARELHNSTLNGTKISVSPKDNELKKDPKLTIVLKNTQQLESFSEEKINSIFAKCGDISSITLICKKHVLGFVTFASEKGTKKALKLNGTTAHGLELEIEMFKMPGKTSVFVQNIKPGVTEAEIRELFASTGEIENVFLKTNFAIVKFKDTDGFCKAFLLDESLLHDQMVFLEPYSEKKVATLRKNRNTPGKKRPMTQNNASPYKKFKRN